MKIYIRVLSLVLLVCMLASLLSCVSLPTTDFGGVTFELHSGDASDAYYTAQSLTEDGKNLKCVVIPPEIDGIPVTEVSSYSLWQQHVCFYSNAMERIYFPYSITFSCDEVPYGTFHISSPYDNFLVFSPSVDCLVVNGWSFVTVVPFVAYEEYRRDVINLKSANIAFMFNYEDAPNEGYFFIDLVEDEGGVLTNPPYDPKREGYTFVGWFKDEGCEDAWSFESDTITLRFDENDYLIYEEIRLYAGWEKQ